MKIGIDAGALSGDKPFKGGNYYLALNIIKQLNEAYKGNNDFILYSFAPINKKILKDLGRHFKNIVAGPKKFWMMFGLPLELLRNPVDLFLGFNQCLPLFLSCKSAVFVLDLAFKLYPELFNNHFKINLLTTLAINKAKIVIAISDSTRIDIVKYYNPDKKKIRVIYPGI